MISSNGCNRGLNPTAQTCARYPGFGPAENTVIISSARDDDFEKQLAEDGETVGGLAAQHPHDNGAPDKPQKHQADAQQRHQSAETEKPFQNDEYVV